MDEHRTNNKSITNLQWIGLMNMNSKTHDIQSERRAKQMKEATYNKDPLNIKHSKPIKYEYHIHMDHDMDGEENPFVKSIALNLDMISHDMLGKKEIIRDGVVQVDVDIDLTSCFAIILDEYV
eukprot:173676_1